MNALAIHLYLIIRYINLSFNYFCNFYRIIVYYHMKTRLFLIAGLALTSFSSWAVPAKRDLRTVTQPDGSTLQVRRVGDESSHFIITSDGMLLSQNPVSGAYEYARITTGGTLVSTGVVASDPYLRPASEAILSTPLSSDIEVMRRAAAPRHAISQNGMGRFTSTFPRKGDVNVLVILVNYKDVKFNLSDPHKYFEAMLNEEGFSQYGGTGCYREYFRDNSNDQFRPHFDLYGPVTLPQNRSYYGANDVYDNDLHPEEMVVDACRLLDEEIDFSKYDNDGDGFVDNVYVFYAGQGEASYGPENSVWPHSWELTSAKINLKLDGVTIDRYACSNEWEQNRPDGIGTFIHEFSHVMGLPDLYTTDYDDSVYYITPGSWSVMDYGPYNNDGRTPPSYSIYERNAMTWIEPRLLSGPETVTLEDIQASNDGCIITTGNETEFFLFENRQQTGWDEYLPGHGMLIWHIDFDADVFDENIVNNSRYHQYVDIIEAGNHADNSSDSALASYPWPGTSGATSFTASTTPAFKDWSGNKIPLPITDIRENAGVITFLVDGGTPLPPPIETPVALEVAEKGEDFFVAAWTPVEGAVDYEVRLFAKGAGEPLSIVADMGSGTTPSLPAGWTSSTKESYTSYGNYGEASPSLKMNKDGAWLETATLDDDISSFSFWSRAQQASASSLENLALIEGEWLHVAEYSPVGRDVLEVTFEEMPQGAKALRFVWHKSAGNLSLDDIVIRTVPGNSLLKTLASTGGLTSTRFDNLEPGEYFYTVAATDGEYVSPHCAPVSVTISKDSGVAGLGAESHQAIYYDMLGRRVAKPLKGMICLEKRGGGVRKVIVR